MPVAGHLSFLDAMGRERVVASDWLVSIDASRYSVPFALIHRHLTETGDGLTESLDKSKCYCYTR